MLPLPPRTPNRKVISPRFVARRYGLALPLARIIAALAHREAFRMKDALDFDAIDQAALAAFPTVLARLLPRGKAVGRELVALNPPPARSKSRVFQGEPLHRPLV